MAGTTPPPRQASAASTYARTPTPQADTALPSYASKQSQQTNGDGSPTGRPRRSSFSFLRSSSRSASGGKMSKKQKALAQEELQRQQREAAASVPRRPPQLPSHAPLPQIHSFGGEHARPDSYAFVANRAGAYHAPPQHHPSHPKASSMAASTPHNVPLPPMPGSGPGEFVDPYARTESITNRGRYSYASSAVSTLNSPRRVRRRRDPTPFNVLVIGAKSSGKTSFINFLRTSLEKPGRKRTRSPSPGRAAAHPDSAFTSDYLETEIDHERIGVTLWDSQGLEKHVVDLQLREMSSFLESKFEDTFTEEQRVVRAPGVQDTHIHCVFLVMDPVRLDSNIAAARKLARTAAGKFAMQDGALSGLDEDLDLQVLRTLQGKTTVIPVISKADTITTAHMNFLKRTVWDSLKQAKLDPLEALDLAESSSDDDDDERLDERDEDEARHSSDEAEPTSQKENAADESAIQSDSDTDATTTTTRPAPEGSSSSTKHRRAPSAMSHTLAAADPTVPYLPMSTISPDEYDPETVGRRFPWGLADPYDAAHCDFGRLKDSVFAEWRAELREAAREQWYEGWRTSRLRRGSAGTPLRGAVSQGQQRAGAPAGRYAKMAPANGRAVSGQQQQQQQQSQLYRGVGSYR